jgi:hypothetical protein
VAAAITSDDREAPDLRPQLERGEQFRDDQTGELQQLAAQVARLRAELHSQPPSARPGTPERTAAPRAAGRPPRPGPRAATVSFRPRGAG